MEATCREIIHRWVDTSKGSASLDAYVSDGGYMGSFLCGAPIPRLDDGPCQYPQCGAAFGDPEHDIGVYVRDVLLPIPRHAYLGPLALECANGHPVAVPTERS